MNPHTTASFPQASARSLGAAGVMPFSFPGVPNVRCAFTTTDAGDLVLNSVDDHERQATSRKNRAALMHVLGLEAWVELQQVHGDAMIVNPAPTRPDLPSLLEADAHCTEQPGLALVIKTADCQPVLLTDLTGSAVAALHAGWRGNVLNLPGKGLAVFCREYGLRPEDVLAVRGPSLGPGAAEFVNFDREWPATFKQWFNSKEKTMDLWALTRHQLIQAGLLPERVFSLDLCTKSLPELFFSYRRGHSGRQMSLIWREVDSPC